MEGSRKRIRIRMTIVSLEGQTTLLFVIIPTLFMLWILFREARIENRRRELESE